MGFVKERYELEIAVSEKKGYENGMAQPGILVLRGGKGGDITGEEGAVLEKCAIVPSTMNLGGASDRPEGRFGIMLGQKLRGKEWCIRFIKRWGCWRRCGKRSLVNLRREG